MRTRYTSIAYLWIHLFTCDSLFILSVLFAPRHSTRHTVLLHTAVCGPTADRKMDCHRAHSTLHERKMHLARIAPLFYGDSSGITWERERQTKCGWHASHRHYRRDGTSLLIRHTENHNKMWNVPTSDAWLQRTSAESQNLNRWQRQRRRVSPAWEWTLYGRSPIRTVRNAMAFAGICFICCATHHQYKLHIPTPANIPRLYVYLFGSPHQHPITTLIKTIQFSTPMAFCARGHPNGYSVCQSEQYVTIWYLARFRNEIGFPRIKPKWIVIFIDIIAGF